MGDTDLFTSNQTQNQTKIKKDKSKGQSSQDKERERQEIAQKMAYLQEQERLILESKMELARQDLLLRNQVNDSHSREGEISNHSDSTSFTEGSSWIEGTGGVNTLDRRADTTVMNNHNTSVNTS